ncbi:MAG: hypothetical protein AAF651_01345 [Cyanobacteria bacterium P01_C01_bin.73]
MPSKSPTDQLLPELTHWDLADLKDLQAVLTGLIEALESSSERSKSTPDDDTGDELEQTPAKQTRGHIETKYIPRGNKRHGPYLYLRYWQGGRLRSKYLGKAVQKG